ncbi:MAG: hypothetical protein ACFB5Z_14960 [Elainellaceae cyanobacterium]
MLEVPLPLVAADLCGGIVIWPTRRRGGFGGRTGSGAARPADKPRGC